jgi:hypothetical protein
MSKNADSSVGLLYDLERLQIVTDETRMIFARARRSRPHPANVTEFTSINPTLDPAAQQTGSRRQKDVEFFYNAAR